MGSGVQRPLRVFIYVQHLSGVGHMVRSQGIGLALAQKHKVSILDGGRRVSIPSQLAPVSIPALARRDGQLIPLDGNLSLTRAFEQRLECLYAGMRECCPDVVLVEHFPFSKHELQGEIVALLEYARLVNPGVRIIASVRDICLRTRHEIRENYEQRVVQLLRRHFDGLLVHADPALCRLDDYFGASDQIDVPVFHTGIVAPEIKLGAPELREGAIDAGEYVVASVGGGADRPRLLSRVVSAWRRLVAEGGIGSRRLRLFSGLDGFPPSLREQIAGEPSIIPMSFDPGFRHWLNNAALSISCAGYNTCASLLATRTPALLLPNPDMSDQLERTRLMTDRGIAVAVPPAKGTDDPMAFLILDNLQRPKTTHSIRLDGARQSAECIEDWVSALPGEQLIVPHVIV